MGITVTHVKSVTIADSTNSSIVRPSDWNSSHAVTLNLSNTDLVKWISAGTASLSSGTVVFASSNGVSFGMTSNSITASVAAGGAGTSRNVVFSGFNVPMGQSTIMCQTSTTSTSRPWVAMPVSLGASQSVSNFVITAGVQIGGSSGTASTDKGTLSMGIYSSSAGTLSTVWTSSIQFSHQVSSTSHSVSFGGGASLWSSTTGLGGAGLSAWRFRVSIPVTLTLNSGTYYFGVMDQMSANGASLMQGVLTNVVFFDGNGASGLVIGSSVTSAIPDEIGILTAPITGAGAAAFPLSLTNMVGVGSYSRYPYAVLK